MTFSRFARRSTSPRFDVILLACIVYGKIIDTKYIDPILGVLKHITGDENITKYDMKPAMDFCGSKLRDGPGSFLKMHWNTFTMLSECFRTIGDKESRKQIVAAFKKAVNYQKVTIHPNDSYKKEWSRISPAPSNNRSKLS